MAVTLRSDLVADVMKNAEPARRRAAEAALQAKGSTFASLVDGQRELGAPSPGGTSMPDVPLAMPQAAHGTRGRASAAEGFERMVLRNLFETLLPDEQSGAFGGGPSAGIWRSMAADQLAGVYAATGGVGIAGMVDGAQATAPRLEPQWPYFRLQSIKSFAG